MSTLVASYLARMRGSSEPENSVLREQTLSDFIRKLRSFLLDHGNESGADHDKNVENFRKDLDRLLIPADSHARRNHLLDPESQERRIG
jgi:deferrochelatase/peroxidase EfeB